MKYFSEVTGKVYDTEKDLVKAEDKALEAEKAKKAKAAQRETRAKEVEKAFKDVRDAQTKANQVLEDFCKDYGSFHMTTTFENMPVHSSLFDYMFDIL